MKKLFTTIVTIIIMQSAFAQGNFQRGDNAINLGIGFGSSLGYTYSSQTPGISASFEHGVWEVGGPGVISLGGYIGYKSFTNKYDYFLSYYEEKWSYTIIGFRGAYHFNGINTDKFDVYGGVMLSYNILSYTNNNNSSFYTHDTYGSALGGSLYIGGRYFISPNFALYSELGYGVSILNFGVSFKF